MADTIQVRIDKAVRALRKRRVLVGVPDDTRPAEDGKSTVSNATLAYINEFGDDELHIPPRPFLVPGVEDAKDQITKILTVGVARALSGDLASVDRTLNAVGLVAQNAVRAKITEGPFVPLKPRTLQARRARGRTGEKPLIDTGALRQAITYVVTDR